LLHRGIEGSSLFLCLAAGDYYDQPEGEQEDGRNWAMQEYDYAIKCGSRQQTPIIRVIDLGGAPKKLRRENRGRVRTYNRNITDLAQWIAAAAHRS